MANEDKVPTLHLTSEEQAKIVVKKYGCESVKELSDKLWCEYAITLVVDYEK